MATGMCNLWARRSKHSRQKPASGIINSKMPTCRGAQGTYGAGPREKKRLKRVERCQVSPVWWTRARRDSRNACDGLLKISIEKFSVESGRAA